MNLWAEEGVSFDEMMPYLSSYLGHSSREDTLEYIRYLQQKNMKPSTINQRLTALKSYLWFCSDEDIALQSLSIMASRIPNVKEPKLVRERLSDGDLKLLFEALENNKRGIRDRAIMILLYDSAIRVSELIGLNIGDIHIDDRYSFIRVHGKGNKEREISIGNRTSDHLRLYNGMYNSDSSKEDPLFYTVYKGVKSRMSAGNIERITRKYADIARKVSDTIPTSVYPHMFRRTRATNLYQNGVELDLVSRTLGHEQIETTKSHYAVPSEEMLRRSMEKAGTNVAEPERENETDEKILKYLGLQ